MRREGFYYRGYLVKVKGPVKYRGKLTVVAFTKQGPIFEKDPKCSCNRNNGFFHASPETIDRSQPSAQQDEEAKRLIPLVERRIKEAIDSHILARHS